MVCFSAVCGFKLCFKKIRHSWKDGRRDGELEQEEFLLIALLEMSEERIKSTHSCTSDAIINLLSKIRNVLAFSLVTALFYCFICYCLI